MEYNMVFLFLVVLYSLYIVSYFRIYLVTAPTAYITREIVS